MDRTGEPFDAAELRLVFDLDVDDPADADAIVRVQVERARQEGGGRRVRIVRDDAE